MRALITTQAYAIIMPHLDYHHSVASLLLPLHPCVFRQHCSRCRPFKTQVTSCAPLAQTIRVAHHSPIASTLMMTCEVINDLALLFLGLPITGFPKSAILDTPAPSQFLQLSRYILTSAPLCELFPLPGPLFSQMLMCYFLCTSFKSTFKCQLLVKEHLFQIVIST